MSSIKIQLPGSLKVITKQKQLYSMTTHKLLNLGVIRCLRVFLKVQSTFLATQTRYIFRILQNLEIAFKLGN